MEHQEKLTIRLLEEFGNRKQEGRLSVITNLNDEGKVYSVPRETEHINFCLNMVIDARKLRKTIPSYIDYEKTDDKYIINSVITGESGIEIGYGITHNEEDLREAHNKILKFINSDEVILNINLVSKIKFY